MTPGPGNLEILGRLSFGGQQPFYFHPYKGSFTF